MKTFVAGLSVLAATASLTAHHNFRAEFDANRPFKISGTVTRVEWFNPHTWFYLDVREIKDEAGRALNMGMEMGSPNALMRAGWRRDSMKIGDEVVVEGFHAHTRKDIGNARVVILVKTGQRLFAASSAGQ
jgi:Family of unknown function (DUF6152)